MLIGYARTSTLDQKAGLEAQIDELQKAGCERIFEEQVSSVDVTARDQLTAALDFARDGDTLVVTRLDRLARSVAHLMQILDGLKAKGANLRILGLGIDTGNSTGKLILTVLGASPNSNAISCWNGSAKVSPRRRPLANTKDGSQPPWPNPRKCWNCTSREPVRPRLPRHSA